MKDRIIEQTVTEGRAYVYRDPGNRLPYIRPSADITRPTKVWTVWTELTRHDGTDASYGTHFRSKAHAEAWFHTCNHSRRMDSHGKAAA